jgi:hypothetical protein
MQPAKRLSTDATAPSGPGRFLLGLGGTIDYEVVWDGALIEALARSHGILLSECDPDRPIADERSLIAVLLGFARTRRGGERFVATPEVIERFAERFDKVVTLGGTCVRAAMMMRTLGVQSTVHLVSIDDDFRRLYPTDCDYISSAVADGMYPHLIVQFPESGKVRLADGIVPIEGSNRVILTNDPPHVGMALSPDLAAVSQAADVVLVSGFNGMTDRTLLARRIGELGEALAGMRESARVLYEDAGFHTPQLSVLARVGMSPLVDVYSMNEDELQGHVGHAVDLLDVAEVTAALRELRALIPGPTLVVHTRFWALAAGDLAGELADALQGGVAAATARYIHGDAATAEDVERVAQGSPPSDRRQFAAALGAAVSEPVCCIPVHAVSVDHPTTIGLGDCFIGGFLVGRRALVPATVPAAGPAEGALVRAEGALVPAEGALVAREGA